MLKYSAFKEQYISESKIVKILSHVPIEKGFHFYLDIGQSTGIVATSLEVFLQKLQEVEARSAAFHFQRSDFQKWIECAIGDVVLVERINKINKLLPAENLRKQIAKTVEKRIKELKILHGESIASQ
jgi:hypothetical protein